MPDSSGFEVEFLKLSRSRSWFGAFWRVDAGPHPEVLARYVNDDLRRPPRHNVRFVKLKAFRVALVVCKRDVRAGEELFASYGRSYWEKRGMAIPR